MPEEKIYTPEVIQDTPFPGQDIVPVETSTQTGTGGTYQQTTSKAKNFPTRRIATELMSVALNTRSKKILQEFQLEQSGGFKIGDFKSGETGEVAITPNGLTAKDSAGLTTFALDGTTGDAVFKGNIQSGSLVTGIVQVGGNNVVIDGDTPSFELRDENDNVVVFIGYQKDGF